MLKHFEKHASQMMQRSGRSLYNIKDYLKDAARVMETGTKVTFRSGSYTGSVNYVRYAGQSRGKALMELVGTNSEGRIITYTFKNASQLDKWGMQVIP